MVDYSDAEVEGIAAIIRPRIEEAVTNGDYPTIIHMRDRENLPRKLRDEAAGKLIATVDNAVERFQTQGQTWMLVELAGWRELPKEKRIEIALKALSRYIEAKNERGVQMISLREENPRSSSDGVPDEVRKVAEAVYPILVRTLDEKIRMAAEYRDFLATQIYKKPRTSFEEWERGRRPGVKERVTKVVAKLRHS